MLASILEAPQQVRISAPSLPHKSAGQELIGGVTLQNIRDINITKRGVLYIKYSTAESRGCSFVSWQKFRKALEEIQQRRWSEKIGVPVDSCAVNYILFGQNDRADRIIKFHTTINNTQTHLVKAPVVEVAPFLVRWNNQFLISAEEARDSIGMTPVVEHRPVSRDLWGKASSGVVDMARLRTERIKKDLETEAAKQNCAIAYFEEDGDTIYTVKDKDGKDLGYVAIDDIGNIFYRSSKDGSVELKVNGGTGAIRGLITAQSFDRATAKSGVMFSKAAEYQHVKDYCNQNKVAVRA